MPEGSSSQRLLLVEDEPVIGLEESRLLQSAGYTVERVTTGEDAVEAALSAKFDLVLMDINLGPGIDGGEASRRIRSKGGPPIVFLSSHSEETAVAKTKDSGGYGYIVKGTGGRILLASVRMALGLAKALRDLAESEGRWESLARTAPDYIFSIGPDRRILFINKAIEGGRPEDYLGSDLADLARPEDREAFIREIERVFLASRAVRYHLRASEPLTSPRRYDIYLGPVQDGGRVVSATAVIRDVSDENRLAMGEALDEARKRTEIRAAMASFDFAPVRELLESFHGFTGLQVSLVTVEGEFYASTPYTRACLCFHTASEETRAACLDADRRIEDFIAQPGRGAYLDYLCANGLRDMAQPLFVEGVHWANLFLGQFLYDDDPVDEAALASRAERLRWDPEDYIAAFREVPRYSREKMKGIMTFFDSLGRVLTSMAYGAFEERLLSRRNSAAAMALDESERRYRLLADNVGDVIWTLDPSAMRFTYVSPSITALRGLSVEEALAEPIHESLSPDSLQKVMAMMGELARRLSQGDFSALDAVTDVFEQPVKGGGTKWVEITTKPVINAEGRVVEITGVSRDATARVLADAELRQSLIEKDTLYAELQHRVKNSLALIVSLLSLQAGAIEEDGIRAPLDEAQTRVRSIGLLYEQLYRTHSVESIDLGIYLPEVARTVVESPIGQKGIRLELDCASLRIATDRAVPAGLLLYELVSNAVKHAFPGRSSGRIATTLRLEDGTICLSVEDDGVGLPPGFDLERSESLGSLLIVQLAAQLGGIAGVGAGLGGAGTGFSVRFPHMSPL